MAHAAITRQKDDGFEVTCPDCGTVGSADEEELADLVARLHDRAFAMPGLAR